VIRVARFSGDNVGTVKLNAVSQANTMFIGQTGRSMEHQRPIRLEHLDRSEQLAASHERLSSMWLYYCYP
jgi:hypothetical protein